MKQSQREYRRIVIKIGSSLLFAGDRKLALGLVNSIAGQIQSLIKDKKEIVIVSSGAIAFGMTLLNLESRPQDLSYLQAAAAIGQNELMQVYRDMFRQSGLNCAQVLLTWEDFSDRKRYLNAKNTLLRLLKLKSIPVINENDTVSTEEIRFGDNDRLSALVASLIGADLLVILSDVEGLLDNEQKVIRVVDEITLKIKELASPTDKSTSVGGMITKIEAAKIAIDSGIPCVIASGRAKDVILSVIEDPLKCGTIFLPKKCLSAREHWIAFGTKPKGKITVDEGARAALMSKKSLLSVGVISSEGAFNCGDIVSVRDKHGSEFARGKARVSGRELDKVKGKRFEREIIHRDDIVIL